MVTVDLSGLEGDAKEDVVEFVEGKLPVKTEHEEGDKVTFEDKNERTHVRSPEVRTYLKRFLHERNLKKRYRLLSRDGSLSFVKIKEPEEEEEEAKKKD